MGDAWDRCHPDPKKIITKSHKNRAHASAQELRGFRGALAGRTRIWRMTWVKFRNDVMPAEPLVTLRMCRLHRNPLFYRFLENCKRICRSGRLDRLACGGCRLHVLPSHPGAFKKPSGSAQRASQYAAWRLWAAQVFSDRCGHRMAELSLGRLLFGAYI